MPYKQPSEKSKRTMEEEMAKYGKEKPKKKHKGQKKEVDRLAGEGSTSDKVKDQRRLRDLCDNPELKNEKMCKGKSVEVKPTREKQNDIYGPGRQ